MIKSLGRSRTRFQVRDASSPSGCIDTKLVLQILIQSLDKNTAASSHVLRILLNKPHNRRIHGLHSLRWSHARVFACNRIPSCTFPVTHPPPRRRLSRQASVTLPTPTGCQLSSKQSSEHMQFYQRAKASLVECRKWILLMQGAESARVVLEHLFASVRIVSVDRVAQILASHRSTVRPAEHGISTKARS